MPSKSGSPRSASTMSPVEVTSCRARTAVARLPVPDPCVPVAIAPATEMCGSEARLCSAARPSRCWASAPYVSPALKLTQSSSMHDVRGQPVQRELLVGVGEVVERVAGAERAQALRGSDDPAQLVERARPLHRGGAVGDVAGPVGGHSVTSNSRSSTVRRVPSHTTTNRSRANSG